LLTGIPEVAEFMLPVPFPHEHNAREESLAMRNGLHEGAQERWGASFCFPAGRVAHSSLRLVRPRGRRRTGTRLPPRWSCAPAQPSLPIRFPGQNTRAYQIAANTSATLRQSLLLNEIRAALNKPQRPVVGHPIPPDQTRDWAKDPRGYLAWLRETTLSLAP
jgi:hypothetical protein